MLEPKKDLFEDIEETLREHYRMQIDPARIAPVEKHFLSPLIKGLVAASVLALIPIVLGGFSERLAVGIGIGIFASFLFCFSFLIKSAKNNWRAFRERCPKAVYDYSLYDDFLAIRISSDTSVKQMKFNVQEIKQVHRIGDFITLEIDRQIYLLNKDELTEGSYFLALCAQHKKAEKDVSTERNKKVARFLLTFFLNFIGSFIINHTALKPKGYTSRTSTYALCFFLCVNIYGFIASLYQLAFDPSKEKNIGYKKDVPKKAS